MIANNGQENPKGWTVKTIEEVAEVNPRLKKDTIPSNLHVSFVPMPAVGAGDGTIDVSHERPFSDVKKGFTPFQEGDVLFAKITPCMENGKMAVVPKLKNGYGFGSTEFHVLRPKDGINPRYLYYYISNKSFRAEAQHYMTGAVGQKRVPTAFLKECKIPLAPPDQQASIVAEIEKQFSRLDEAVANLKRVKDNLKRYKAAVLKAAVEGKLTEDWRKAHPDVEPASELLKRILAERRNRWNGKGKYKEPEAPDTINLPALPESWTWTTLDQLLIFLRNGISIKPTAEIGLRILRISAVRPLAVNLNDVRFLRATKEEFTDYILDPGDLLFTRYNGSPALVGVCAVVPRGNGTTVHPDKVIRGVLVSTLSLPMFVAIMANMGVSRDHLARRVRTTAGQAGISGGDLRTMPIPLGPVGEQEWIVEEVERRLSVIRELEGQVATDLQRAERFRQSILQRAFEGKLLSPQVH